MGGGGWWAQGLFGERPVFLGQRGGQKIFLGEKSKRSRIKRGLNTIKLIFLVRIVKKGILLLSK